MGSLITSPPVGKAKYCDGCVCLSVCLSVHEHTSGTTHPIFIFFVRVSMALALSSSNGVTICYVLPVLWMTSHLHTLGHMYGCRCNTGTASQPDRAAPARRLGRGPSLVYDTGNRNVFPVRTGTHGNNGMAPHGCQKTQTRTSTSNS